MVNRLGELTSLPQGWDGHGGQSVDPAVARFTLEMLGDIMRPDTPLPQLMPLSCGGIQVEWHRNGWDVEIEISKPGQVFVYLCEVSTGKKYEEQLGADFRRLDRAMALVTGRN